MKIAHRVAAMKPSSTLAVNSKAAALRARGEKILSFAAGEPDFDTPQRIKQAAIDALNRGETKYCPVPGDMETRKVVAEKLAQDNRIPGVTAEHVVLSSGGKHSLYLLFQTLIDPPAQGQPPAEVILPVPAWVSYAPQIELAGGRVVEVRTSPTSDFKMSPDQLRAAITPRSRALVINSPSNPCGTMYTPAELRALADIVAHAAETIAPELVIISDELYEKVIFGGIEHLSIGSLPNVAERTITVNGLSKAFAMTGWRIGYAAGTADFGLRVSKGMQTLQSQSTTSIATFELAAVRVALTQCADDVERMRQAFARRAALIHSLISTIPGLVSPRPTGAFYVFPDLSAHFNKRSPAGTLINSAASFAGALLDEHRVACVPGEDFGSGGEKSCRFSFACSDDDIREGMSRLAEFIASLR